MKAERLGDDLMRELNTQVMLRVIDTRWMNYLQEMDYLKTGIGLRGFGQRDPLVEYKTEAYGAFQMLVDTMYEDYLRTVLRIEIKAARVPWSTRRSPRSRARASPVLPRSMVTTATRCCASRRRCRPARLSKADRLPSTTVAR